MQRMGLGLVLCALVVACAGETADDSDVTSAATADAVEIDEVLGDEPETDSELSEGLEPGDTTEIGEVVIPGSLGDDRPAALYVPSSYDPEATWPLVILLHGYGVNGMLQAAYMGLIERVESSGFVLVVPDGTANSEGLRFWNASPSCCNFEGTDVDDVAYILSLIAQAKQSLNIDPDRVTLLGHSNGGFMSYRMVCDAADQITAIATIAGSMTAGIECTPSRPVSVLAIHGTKDEDIGFDGGTIMGADYLGAEALVESWVERNACSPEAKTDAAPIDYDVVAEGAETTIKTWSGCTDGTRVAFWRMQDSPHIPPFTKRFKDALLDFLLKP